MKAVKSRVPNEFDRDRAQKLLDAAKPEKAAGSRMDSISTQLIGLPYRSNPLVGSADFPEVFTVALEYFDCVTFAETVLALAQSRNNAAFLDRLRSIRYGSGKIDWKQRNHYMTEWIRNNVRLGSITRIADLQGKRDKDRLLNVVPGLPARRTKFSCLPKSDFLHREDKLRTGDLIFFASTRSHLDVFHCGILIRKPTGVVMRHASRSRGAVVEQNIDEFLKSNRMAGVIVVRPAEIS